jgi:hypothetical protein
MFKFFIILIKLSLLLMTATSKITSAAINQKSSESGLLKYSKAISDCSVLGTIYAKCIVSKSENNLNKNHCEKEFIQFKDCVKNVNTFKLSIFLILI